VRRVLEQIELELECFALSLGPTRVRTIYVGGGTPSLLAPESLDRLLEAGARFVRAVGRGADPDRGGLEWTVEANPESLNREHLEICASHGVNRLSIGVQSFHDRILSTLGRPAGARESRAALELVRSEWPGQISLDLMSGVPGAPWPVLRRDLEEALAYAPEHLSLYSLTLDDPAHPLARDINPERQDRLWLRGHRWLEEQGYRNYEISNFARPGFESLHNLRYWRLEPYLGVGPAAVSTLPGSRNLRPDRGVDRAPAGAGNAGRPAVLRLTNPESLGSFLGGPGALWGIEIEEIAPREFLFETLMMGLRLRDGIDAAAFVARFGRSLPELLPGLWRRWAGRGLLVGTGAGSGAGATGPPSCSRYALSFEGRMVLDRLLLELQGELERPELEDLSVVCWGAAPAPEGPA